MLDWSIELHDDVDAWFMRLVKEDPEAADLIEQAIDMLAARGSLAGAAAG
jgi:hypothetical protein